jgi:hypothetical protein
MKITREKLHDTFGVIFIAFGVLILFGLISKDSLGKFSGMVQFIYSLTFGDKISFIIPVFLFIEGYYFIKMESPFKHARNVLSFFILASAFSSAIGVFNYGADSNFFSSSKYEYGDLLGFLGFKFSGKLIEYMGYSGSLLTLLTLFLIIVLFISNFRVMQIARFVAYPFVKTFQGIYAVYNWYRKNQARKKLEKEMREKEEAALKPVEKKQKR